MTCFGEFAIIFLKKFYDFYSIFAEKLSAFSEISAKISSISSQLAAAIAVLSRSLAKRPGYYASLDQQSWLLEAFPSVFRAASRPCYDGLDIQCV
jgi:hypothetical protein